MLYKHIVKYRSGNEVEHSFRSKKESDKALQNAKYINKTFGTIVSVTVQAANFPERKSVYEF